MAARLNPAPFRPLDIRDLRRIDTRSVEALLQEETAAWWRSLEWDFNKSADLVRRFIDLRALDGFALLDGDTAIGYVYYVLEERKGLMGDLYLMHDYRTSERERLLLEAALQAIMAQPEVARIESQLMLLEPSAIRTMPCSPYLSSFERNFMRIDLRSAVLTEGPIRRPIAIGPWSDHYQESAAWLISAAYQGHVDSQINDQYRTAAGARRFLYNIVQYPGCGSFFRPASFAAFSAPSGTLCGVSLASLVSAESGHITQICVSPEMKGSGVGHALLRQSLVALRDLGCRSATLTVTAANAGAVTLYERVGFRTIRRFSAWVWEGFQQAISPRPSAGPSV